MMCSNVKSVGAEFKVTKSKASKLLIEMITAQTDSSSDKKSPCHLPPNKLTRLDSGQEIIYLDVELQGFGTAGAGLIILHWIC